MKGQRWLSCLLALCLTGGTACAESMPLRVIDAWETADAYQAAYPDRAIEVNQAVEDENADLNTILLEGDWDAAFIDTDQVDLAALYAAGLAADLSAFPEAMALIEKLYPSIRDAVTIDGKPVALPAGFAGSLTWGVRLLGTASAQSDEDEQKAVKRREALGFAPSDAPTSFAELCTLGERYMSLSAEARIGTTFVQSTGNPTRYVLSQMIDMYEAQYLATGQADRFDTAVFREALAQVDALGRAFAVDPKRRYDKDGGCCNVIVDCSNALIGDVAFLRLGENESIPAFMGMVVINPNSENASQALDYLLLAAKQNESQLAPVLYRDVDFEALVRQSYDDEIAMKREGGAQQSVLEYLTALRDAGDARYYHYTKEQIERYAANVAPRLVFPRMRYLHTGSVIDRYLSGETDADGLIAALDAF